MNGLELIAAERQRQIEEEGWTPEHDAGHSEGELAEAAACYAMPERARLIPVEDETDLTTGETTGIAECLWPWVRTWWKPTPDNRIRELAKAGALIAAEIDRLQAIEIREKRNFSALDRVTAENLAAITLANTKHKIEVNG